MNNSKMLRKTKKISNLKFSWHTSKLVSREIKFGYSATSIIIAFTLILGINFGIRKRSCLIFIYTFKIMPVVSLLLSTCVCFYITWFGHIFCKKHIQFCLLPFNFDYNVFPFPVWMFFMYMPCEHFCNFFYDF